MQSFEHLPLLKDPSGVHRILKGPVWRKTDTQTIQSDTAYKRYESARTARHTSPPVLLTRGHTHADTQIDKRHESKARIYDRVQVSTKSGIFKFTHAHTHADTGNSGNECTHRSCVFVTAQLELT